MPEALAGACVECDEAIAKEAHAVAVGAVEIVGRRAEREICNAAFFVDRDFAPGVDAADVLVRFGRPRVVAKLAGQRDGVEDPRELASADVGRAEMAGG